MILTARYRVHAVSVDPEGRYHVAMEPVYEGAPENAEAFAGKPAGLIRLGPLPAEAGRHFAEGVEVLSDFEPLDAEDPVPATPDPATPEPATEPQAEAPAVDPAPETTPADAPPAEAPTATDAPESGSAETPAPEVQSNADAPVDASINVSLPSTWGYGSI